MMYISDTTILSCIVVFTTRLIKDCTLYKRLITSHSLHNYLQTCFVIPTTSAQITIGHHIVVLSKMQLHKRESFP